MNSMLTWNILAMVVLAFPCGLILKACWDGMFSGIDPKLFMGMFLLIGLGYAVFIADLAYFREEEKHD
jgi:hypothetical protein